MPSTRKIESRPAPPAYPDPPPATTPKLPSRVRLLAFIPLALALIAILMVVLVGPAAAASWVDSEDDVPRGTAPGQVPVKLFKLVPFLLKVRSEAKGSTESYFYGATNQCVHQAIGGMNGTGVATCGTQTMFEFLKANAGRGTVGMGNLVKFDNYYRTRVAPLTIASILIESFILFGIACLSAYALYKEYKSRSLKKSYQDAAEGSPERRKAKEAHLKVKPLAERSARWTVGTGANVAHGIGIVLIIVSITVIAAGSEQQVPEGTICSPSWGFGLIIMVAILHAMSVVLPNVISHYRASSKKKSKSKA